MRVGVIMDIQQSICKYLLPKYLDMLAIIIFNSVESRYRDFSL
uniref:Uncharacterized protein n=1 Tax=Anguilla anguilla TaxID=7936 RepID=A0A0E9W5E8_ANGAN